MTGRKWHGMAVGAVVALLVSACSGAPSTTQPPPPDSVSAHLRMVSGDQQTGIVNLPLANPYVVQLLDSLGRPVVDAVVRGRTIGKWSGTVDSLVHTDTAGFAQFHRVLGPQTGIQQTWIRSSVAPKDTVVFTDSVTAAIASRRR